MFHLIRQDVDYRLATSMGSKKVQFINCFKGCLGHSYRACIQFWNTLISLISTFPHSIIGNFIRSFYVKNKILYEGHLVKSENNT